MTEHVLEPPLFVLYYRVSTERQGMSGLGLEAQRMAVHAHLKASGGLSIGEFTEIESGRRKDRPELTAAIDLCRKRRASLVIAKLDRLARNVAFVCALLESNVKFVAADMPEADTAFLQIASVFAEWEARKISERTKAALAMAKERGKQLGWANPARAPSQKAAAKLGAFVLRERADRFAANSFPVIESIRKAGVDTLQGMADALNARGIKTQRDAQWYPSTVKKVLDRIGR